MVLGGDGLNTGGGGGGTGGGIYCARACWIRPQALNITAHPPNDNWVRADRLSLLIGIVAPFEPAGLASFPITLEASRSSLRCPSWTISIEQGPSDTLK